jgi:hypothetical protein
MLDEIGNLISTLFQRRNSNVNPICIVNPFSTSIQRLEGHFQLDKRHFARWVKTSGPVHLPQSIV